MSEEKKEADPIYEIKLKEHLDTKWVEWFYDMTITHESDGTTTLSGPLPDQTVLHSVLDRIRDMNLTLISALQVQGVPEEELKSNPSEGVPEE